MVEAGFVLVGGGLVLATVLLIAAKPVRGAAALGVAAFVVGAACLIAGTRIGTSSGSEAAASLILGFVGLFHFVLGIALAGMAAFNRSRRDHRASNL